MYTSHALLITLLFIVSVMQWCTVSASTVKKNMEGSKQSFQELLSESLNDPHNTGNGKFPALSIMKGLVKTKQMNSQSSDGKLKNYDDLKAYVAEDEQDVDAFVPFSARMVAPSVAPEPREFTSCWKRRFKFFRRCVEICYDYILKGSTKVKRGPVYLRYCRKSRS